MAIVKMSKFNLFSFNKDREELLDELQLFKHIHFNDLKVEGDDLEEVRLPKPIADLDETISKARWSIDLLEGYEGKKSSLDELKEGKESLKLSELIARAEGFDFKGNYERLKDLSDKKDKLKQDYENNLSLIDELKPWVNLSVNESDIQSLTSTKVATGSISVKNYDSFLEAIGKVDLAYVEEASRSADLVYLAVAYDKKVEEKVLEVLRNHIFINISLKTEGPVKEKISSLEEENRIIEKSIDDLEDLIKSEVHLLEDLRVYYSYLTNKKLKLLAEENFIKTNQVNIMEGYFPSDLKEKFISLLDKKLGTDYYIDIEEADLNDPNVPIKLSNNKFVEPFESLTEMYSMPKYNEIDPTPLFAPFYFIFAGIMVGDLGYGILITVLSFLAPKIFNLDESKKKFIKFFMYLGISTCFWGFIFGSVFGDAIPMKAYIDPSKDYIAMIMLSMILGGIHIFFALAIKAYMDIRDHKPLDALYDVGSWYMIIVGAVIAIASKAPTGIPEIIFKVSLFLMAIGAVIVLLTGGRQEESLAGKIGWGVYSLYGVTSYFGDFVSYIRLMALALSGSFIAIAVNIIVRMLLSSGVLGIIAGVIIFIVFQLFNVFLSFLSAYVHSARLTYVEMFNKFYEGGGIPFREMVEESNYFNIKEE